MTALPDADALIARLRLAPHPEGGWYRQTWAGPARDGRPEGTCIHFLLKSGERSHWHKVDAAELWLFHGGDPLTLRLAETQAGPAAAHTLGMDLAAGARPQIVVPAHHWQSAEPAPAEGPATGWSLVSCTVTPGFRFEGFTLAPPGFTIP